MLEFLTLASWADSSWYSFSVKTLVDNFESMFFCASWKNFSVSFENLPYLELGANFIATSLAMFLTSITLCEATDPAKGIAIPTIPPALPAVRAESKSKCFKGLLLACIPLLTWPNTSCMYSVPNSVIPASPLAKAPASICLPNCLNWPLNKEAIPPPLKPNAFCVAPRTLPIPNLSAAVITPAKPAEAAISACLPSSSAFMLKALCSSTLMLSQSIPRFLISTCIPSW